MRGEGGGREWVEDVRNMINGYDLLGLCDGGAVVG